MSFGGFRIIGSRNIGYWNTGDYNTGQNNAGDMNSGDFNTGDFNVGSGNTGSKNHGDYNSGFYNQGSYNTGDWNICDRSSGVFCNIEDKLRFFNRSSGLTHQDWAKSEACRILRRVQTTRWIDYEHMSASEKGRYMESKKNGGYLKTCHFKEACWEMWRRLTVEERAILLRMPNFDPCIFYQITGIDCQ